MKLTFVLLFAPLVVATTALSAESTPVLPAASLPAVEVPAVDTTVALPKLPDRPIVSTSVRPETRPVAALDSGEFAYVRVIADDADFEVIRQLPRNEAGTVRLADVRVPVFSRQDVAAEDALRKSALSLDWGDQNIREFEEVPPPVHKNLPAGLMVYWFAPRADLVERYGGTPNSLRRVRLSYRQPLIRGRVVFAPSLPATESEAKSGRNWHCTLLVRSLRSNVLGKVSAGVENERLADSLFIFLRDEPYVEVVAAPPSRPAAPGQ